MSRIRTFSLIGILYLAATAHGFGVTAKSAIIVDEESGKVLWQKDAFTPRYPASTTKIMTGLLLLEHTKPADWIVAPKGVEKVPPSSMHLRPGEKVSARGMLYALMLRSANDGCVAVACHISGSVGAFAKLMNERAKEIGCLNTHFNNPNGLNDKAHTTTAYDLALMAREAMKNPDFQAAVRSQKKTIVRSINLKDVVMESHNAWLAKDATADGIKTGYTRDAGKCYVGSVVRNGYRLITVILNSEDWQADHKVMLEWAYKVHARDVVASPETPIGAVKLENSSPTELPLVVKDPVFRVHRVDVPDPMATSFELNPNLQSPIDAGQQVGTVTYSDGSGWTKEVPVYAGASTDYDPPLLGTTAGKSVFGILGLAVFGSVASLRSKRRNRFHAKSRRPFKY
jgi:D-alanyl-D-alanine carboxypeptidase